MQLMMVTLDQADLISLVKGTQPHYHVMGNAHIVNKGTFSDQFGWQWNDRLKKCTEFELWQIYILCKNSWHSKINKLIMNEDDLPEGLTNEEYTKWYADSRIVDGVRMGPRL